MARINLSVVMKEVLWEQCLNTQRSIQLEHSLTAEQKTRGIFKEYVSFLRKTLTSEHMLTVQRFFAPTITEAEISDDELADIIAQAAQELGDKVPDAEYLTDPDKLDVSALDKGDVENGIRTESNGRGGQLLTEGFLMTVLALPALAKLLAELIEWAKRKFGKYDEGEQQALIFLDLIYKQAKKTNQIPSKTEILALAKKEGFLGLRSSIATAYALREDPDTAMQKDIETAFQKIAQAVGDANNKTREKGQEPHGASFTPEGKEAQPADKHMLHILHDLTFSSKGAKWVANAGHVMHDAILFPIRAVLTPILAAKYGILKRDSWKKAWKKSHAVANVIYIGIMLIVMTTDAIQYFASNSALSQIIGQIFGSMDDLITTAKTTIKAGDLTASAIEEFILASGIAKE